MKNNIVFDYFVSSYNELKKVKWPTKKDVLYHLIIVIVAMVITTLILAALDYGLSYLVQYLVEKKY